eukprot:5655558-Pyramimonas_sp.AAC.1
MADQSDVGSIQSFGSPRFCLRCFVTVSLDLRPQPAGYCVPFPCEHVETTLSSLPSTPAYWSGVGRRVRSSVLLLVAVTAHRSRIPVHSSESGSLSGICSSPLRSSGRSIHRSDGRDGWARGLSASPGWKH